MAELKELLNSILPIKGGREIAACIKKSESYVTQIRQGAQIPTDETLARLAEKYAPHQMGHLLRAAAIARLEKQDFESQELKTAATIALAEAIQQPDRPRIDGRRSLRDFPDAFYPLAVVTGDRRESRQTWITIADLGAYTASPADTRWLFGLGLQRDVVMYIDKNFLLLKDDELIQQFGETNLLVVGSPAANHLARIVNPSAIFRFNYSTPATKRIDLMISDAQGLTKTELAAYKERQEENLARTMRSLFAGGIMDPTYANEYIVAKYSQIAPQTQLDFGVLTFCENPYYKLKCHREGKDNDHKYVTIMAAGIHHPGTAHAVRMLGSPKALDHHPYGGVLRIEMDLDVPFPNRVQKATCRWEDDADEARQVAKDQEAVLREQLTQIEMELTKGGSKSLEITMDQVRTCRRLLDSLSQGNADARTAAKSATAH